MLSFGNCKAKIACFPRCSSFAVLVLCKDVIFTKKALVIVMEIYKYKPDYYYLELYSSYIIYDLHYHNAIRGIC